MTQEREAEIRRWYESGLPISNGMAEDLLAEVDRLREEVERLEAEVERRTNIFGVTRGGT